MLPGRKCTQEVVFVFLVLGQKVEVHREHFTRYRTQGEFGSRVCLVLGQQKAARVLFGSRVLSVYKSCLGKRDTTSLSDVFGLTCLCEHS